MNTAYRILPAVALALLAGTALAAAPLQPTTEKFPRLNSNGHYRLDRQPGRVQFGNGAHGRRPPSGAAKTSKSYRKGATTKLNPQPEPPSHRRHLRQRSSTKLNPQPEPPSHRRRLRRRSSTKLNPQPEPPSHRRYLRRRSSTELNPQPEPPSHPGEKVKLNPQPEPPSRRAKLPAIQGRPAPGAATKLNPQPEPPSRLKNNLPAVQ